VPEYEASEEAIGAFLMQNKDPIDFESRNLHPREMKYSIYDKEMLVIYACIG
jgi:hypothetical protein